MNDVPVIFYEQVASQFYLEETLLAASSLRGLLGRVISSAYAKKFLHYIWVTNGQLEDERAYNCDIQSVSIETPSANYFWYTGIIVSADSEKYITNSKATERVLSATKGKHVMLYLKTSNISEEIAKCVESIRLVFDLLVETKITSDVLKMMRSLVEKNTLNFIDFDKGVEIEDETTQLLVDLLKQKQFHRMYFRGKSCSAALKEIIDSWRENSEEMVGKMVYCEEEFSELQFSSTEFPFQECIEEEERDAKLAYPFAADWPYITTKFMLRNQDGSAVYWYRSPSVEFESVFLFV